MTSATISTNDFLGGYRDWIEEQKESLLSIDDPFPVWVDQPVSQGVTFVDDFKRHIHELSCHTRYELLALIKTIGTVVAAPFALFVELFQLCRGSINAITCLENICLVPKHLIVAIFQTLVSIVLVVNKVVNIPATATGFLIWHGGERLVRLISGDPHTVLSDNKEVRDIVYSSLGLVALAAGALLIPIVSIQMVALPVILGAVYGTINNQFTVRECPEYYTMGHYYDGEDLKGHAVKTNNTLIKPIVTGCYATTAITKIAGLALMVTGTLPFTAAILPLSLAAAMVGGVVLLALVVAHVASTIIKNMIQSGLDEYAELIGIQWTEDDYNKTWEDLEEMRSHHIANMRDKLKGNQEALARFEEKIQKLSKTIQSNILSPDLPMKYIKGWQANNVRNACGYVFAGGGTIVATVATVFLRIFAL
ncbi:MAG: hypothetical protein K940chlam2_00563 [Chlamydiae bacterium]|nr:hypothetical protein [Chlamydiota bacterium]